MSSAPDADAVPQPPADAQLARQLAEALGETEQQPRQQIATLIELMGGDAVQALLAEVLTVEAAGGLLLPGGRRRRTPGGVFFYLARRRLPEALHPRVFPPRLVPPASRTAPPATQEPRPSRAVPAPAGRARVLEVTPVRPPPARDAWKDRRDFVRSAPSHLSAEEVAAEGRQRGLPLTPVDVRALRGEAQPAAATWSSPGGSMQDPSSKEQARGRDAAEQQARPPEVASAAADPMPPAAPEPLRSSETGRPTTTKRGPSRSRKAPGGEPPRPSPSTEAEFYRLVVSMGTSRARELLAEFEARVAQALDDD